MKLGILAWKPGEAESVGIAEESRARGHDTVVFGLDDIGCADTPSGTSPMIGDIEVAKFDVVLSRAHVGHHNWRDSVERLQLLASVPGVLMLDPADTHIRTVSKFTMLHQLSQAGIRVPPTRSCRTTAEVTAAHRQWGSVVLKPSVGFRGIDVERFDDALTDDDLTKAASMLAKYGTLICQPFFPHEGDLRVLVIGEKAAMCTRFHTGGDTWKPFPGNGLAPGADWNVRVEIIQAPPGVAEIGCRATAATGLSYAGVDVIEVDGQPLVLEVNVVPGWSTVSPEIQKLPNRAVVDLIEQRFAEFQCAGVTM